MNGIANTPEPPYWAVIFTSQDNGGGLHPDYARTAEAMVELAQKQPGFLGFESVRDRAGAEITVSYWESEAAIAGWKAHADHMAAQIMGREKFYRAYHLRVARVERARRFTK